MVSGAGNSIIDGIKSAGFETAVAFFRRDTTNQRMMRPNTTMSNRNAAGPKVATSFCMMSIIIMGSKPPPARLTK